MIATTRPVHLATFLLVALPSLAITDRVRAEPATGAAVAAEVCTVTVTHREGPLRGRLRYTEREPTVRHEITPARLAPHREEVVIRDAAVDLMVEPARLKLRSFTAELVPERSAWVRGALDGTRPLSMGDVQDLRDAGIRTDDIDPDRCLHEYHVPADPRTVRLEVAVREPVEVLEVEPPRFRGEKHALERSPAYRRLVAVPGRYRDVEQRERVSFVASGIEPPVQYETVTVQELEQAPMVTAVEIPADIEYVDVERKVSDATLVRRLEPARHETLEAEREGGPGRYHWLSDEQHAQRGDKGLAAGARATGRVVCHRRIPSVTREYRREVVVRPARAVARPIAARTRTVDVHVLEREAQVTEHPVPARVVERQVSSRPLPARSSSHVVPCREALHRQTVRDLQAALRERGFSPGPIDGIMGRGTRRAVRAFQREQGLETRAGLTMETLGRLGLPSPGSH